MDGLIFRHTMNNKYTIIGVIVAVGLIGVALVSTQGCDAACQAMKDEKAALVNFGSLNPEMFKERTAGTVLLDIRTPEEYESGYIEGATQIDYYAADFRQRLSTLDKDASYSIYCRSGNRSGDALSIMEDMGFANVYDLKGGIIAWQGAGLPVVQ